MSEELTLTPKEIEDSNILAGIETGKVTTTAGKIVYDILHDLNDRRGIKNGFSGIDKDVMLELVQTHMKLVKSHIYLI